MDVSGGCVACGQVLDLARLAGFEPATPAFGGQYSIQLSYRRFNQIVTSSCPRLQSNDLILRRAVLYPAELRAL